MVAGFDGVSRQVKELHPRRGNVRGFSCWRMMPGFADRYSFCYVPGVSMSGPTQPGPRCLPIRPPATPADRKRVVLGKSVSVRVDLGGRRIIHKNNIQATIPIAI